MEALLKSTKMAASYSFVPGWTFVSSSLVSLRALLATPSLVLMAAVPISGTVNVTVYSKSSSQQENEGVSLLPCCYMKQLLEMHHTLK